MSLLKKIPKKIFIFFNNYFSILIDLRLIGKLSIDSVVNMFLQECLMMLAMLFLDPIFIFV